MSQVALVFPGQGSQSVGMLKALADEFETVAATLDEASEALGRDLRVLIFEGPEAELNQTRWTQPALLAADVAVWRCYREIGGELPSAMAGHSLGEYAALVAAEAMSLGDAIRVVARRGELMQAAVAEGEGAMAAILGLDDDAVRALCEGVGLGGVAVPANFNAPGQVVVAGLARSVEEVMEAARKQGAKRVLRLPVSVPAHSPLMAPAQDGLRAVLEQVELRVPQSLVLHNVGLEPRRDPESIRAALVEQLVAPVPWTETVRALSLWRVTRFLECGPGRVLCGLGKRIDRSLEWLPLETPEALRAAVSG
ncbi:MAG: ACP S-malonyltransferase [Wenzhouxiangellaceae bacterium]|nr:ACP S-malonyltransferase [Wenzhouxiangellaceae bacterium]